MIGRISGLNPWQRAGLRFLAAYAGLALLGLARLLAVQSDLDGLDRWLAGTGPVAITGLALLIAGWFRAANHYLRISLACLWAYFGGFLLLLAVDFSRPPPGSFDSYGSIVFVGLVLMSPLLIAASACWPAGWLAADSAKGAEGGFASGVRLFGQLLVAVGLGLGGTLGLGLGWLAWQDSLGQYQPQAGPANNWWVGLGYAGLLLAGVGLASWLISRTRPDAVGGPSRQ